MTKYHVHVVKIIAEYEFDIEADNKGEALDKALKLPLTAKNKVKMIGPKTKKMAITHS